MVLTGGRSRRPPPSNPRPVEVQDESILSFPERCCVIRCVDGQSGCAAALPREAQLRLLHGCVEEATAPRGARWGRPRWGRGIIRVHLAHGLLFRLKAKSASPSSAKGLNAASPAAQTTASAATSSRTTEEPSAQRSGSGAGPKETVTWRAVVERMAGERRHSGRQVSASTPSASPRSGQGRSRSFQLRPASSDRKRPRLLAA